MGWRTRDWAKFNESERDLFFGTGGRGVSTSPHRIADSFTASLFDDGGEDRRTTLVWLGVGLALLGACAYFFSQAHGPVRPTASRATPTAGVVAIRWRSTDLAPAAAAGRICVSDTSYGRFCASYVAGERPADTLTREIARQGLTVRSSG